MKIALIATLAVAQLCFLGNSTASAASLVDGIANATPSLVHILITPKPLSQDEQSKLPQPGSSLEKKKNGIGIGSGVVISADGYIYSINQLFKNAEKIQIWTSDKRRFDARIVGRDPVQNIALLKIDATGLVPARIGNPMQAKLGEAVFSAGMLPEEFDFNTIVTEGIISTVGFKNPGSDAPLIQTTSQIAPAMGGGGLFNERGELLGLSSVIYVNRDLLQAISFAIPIDHAMAVLAQLKQYGRIRRSAVGMRLGELTGQVAAALGSGDITGTLVQAVTPGGPADQAGIQPGDVITQFGQAPVKHNVDVFKAAGPLDPGTTVAVKVWRNGQTKELPLTTRELLLPLND